MRVPTSLGSEIVKRRKLPEADLSVCISLWLYLWGRHRIVPYLRDLGITHFYASPFLKPGPEARTGMTSSTTTVSTPRSAAKTTTPPCRPLATWVGQIFDVVPNHMGSRKRQLLVERRPRERAVLALREFFDIAWYARPA